jgi:hypothetical protein
MIHPLDDRFSHQKASFPTFLLGMADFLPVVNRLEDALFLGR